MTLLGEIWRARYPTQPNNERFEMTNNEVVPIVNTDVVSGISAAERVKRLANPAIAVYSSFKSDTFDDRIKTVMAITSAVPLADHLGEVINLRNVVTQIVEVNDEDSGTTVETVRTILVDDNGMSYAAFSDGLLNSLQSIFAGLGDPSTWNRAIPVAAIELRSRKGYRFISLTILPQEGNENR